MTKKRIDRLSVIHRREIVWLRWYFLRDKVYPKRTILEQKIHNSFLKDDKVEASFLVNLKTVTDEVVSRTDKRLLRVIKEVYVYETINVIGACQKILYLSTSAAYNYLNQWFDNYFYATYKHLPLKK